MFSTLRFAVFLPGLAPMLVAATAFQVTIDPAPVERAAQVVSIALPQALAAGAVLRDDRGQIVPLQAEADLTARFIVARQAANQALTFTLEAGRLPDQGNVQVMEEPSPARPGNTPGIASATAPSRIQAKSGRLRVSVGGRPILYYQMDPDAAPREGIDPALHRAGYLHPVLTPRGMTVTEDYPTGNLTQHGIAPLGPENSHLDFGGIDNTWTGPVHGGFTSWQRWIDDKAADRPVLINEAWELTAYAVPKLLGEINVFDLVITQTNATAGLLNYRRGLGAQGPTVWAEPDRSLPFWEVQGDGGFYWTGFSGRTKDDATGMAVLLPSPANSFAERPQMNRLEVLSPSKGRSELPSGARSTQRCRVVVFDGALELPLLEALWNGYTLPAVVTIAPAAGR